MWTLALKHKPSHRRAAPYHGLAAGALGLVLAAGAGADARADARTQAKAGAPALAQDGAAPATPSGAAAKPRKVVRLALPTRENNFDPAQVADAFSSTLVSSLFDAPLTYDLLARPARLKPNTAAALPEVHDNHTRFVFHIKPGIHFTDHPAFKGQPRELTADDYVYSIKRYYDPATRSPVVFHYENAGLLGLSELRRKALATKSRFEYDTPVEGLRALGRYSFEIKLARPAPRLPYVLASGALAGALAREVVEIDPTTVGERPVGTGPFKLAEWKRGARIVLDKNPVHRHSVHDETPNADDVQGQALAAKFRGRALPLLDRVEINVVEEAQPRWLSFLNRQVDVLALPNEFVDLAAPKGKVAPHLAKVGVQVHRQVAVSTWYTYFGMENAVVGGYEPHRVALRRAIALAYDSEREIKLLRRSQGMRPQTLLPPGIPGYDENLRTEMSEYSLPRARALLQLYGYADSDGDGWREQPDGKPLVIEHRAEATQFSRENQQLWQKSFNALGIRSKFSTQQMQENQKASRAGQLMMWSTGSVAVMPDASHFLDMMYGKNKGMSNHTRFNLPELNALHEKQRAMPDGPERFALVQQALMLGVAHMPMKATTHPVNTWLSHKGVVGFVVHPFIRDYWRYLDVEPSAARP